MIAPNVGLVGRTVMMTVKRGEAEAVEPCEVVACQTGGDYGGGHAEHGPVPLIPGSDCTPRA